MSVQDVKLNIPSAEGADIAAPKTELILALQAIAVYFGRPSSETVLFSGSPIDFSNPSVEEIERIANRIGLEISTISKGVKGRIKPELPFLVLSNQCEPFAVLEEVEPGSFSIGGKGPSGNTSISLAEIKQMVPTDLISFSAIYLNAEDRIDLGDAAKFENRHWLRGTLAPFWRSYAIVAVAALFINLIGLASPVFIMNVYDRILPNQAISSLWVLGIGVIGALIFDFFLKLARSAIIDHTGRKADQKLSYMLFEKVLHSQLASRPAVTGEFTNRIGQYEFVREFFASNTISVLIDSFFVFIFLFVIYSIAGMLALIPAAAFLLAVLVGLVAQYRIGKRVAKAANEAAERNGLLVESVATIETIKSLRAEAQLLQKWKELTKNSSRTSEEIKQISARATNATQLITQLVSIFVVIGGAYQFAAGNISSGGIIATVMLSSRTIAPLGPIAMTLARLRQAMLSLKILDGIMNQPEDRPQTTGFVNRQIKQGGIVFQAMEFTYPGTDNAVLFGITTKIEPGERIGIIGKIGSGKTTLGKLVSGLYMPTGGRLLIDGVDVRQYHPQEVRKAVSFAGQNADLFSGTLKQNLLIAKPEATDEEIISVAKRTGVDDFASRHPRGYDMPVGERGDQLSGGQKQAVAIARLLLADSMIVFLDEPTGAMDLASERVLLSHLSRSFSPETTLIISTHRYSLLELVDRIIVLDNGRIVADGPKQQVMAALAQRAKQAAENSNDVK